MRNDLISRQAAIDALFELYEYQRDIDPTEAADLVRQGIFLAEKKIETLPSAQPERKKGKWILSGCVFICSECGRVAFENEKKILSFKSDFCSNCGADMREGEKE